MTIDTFTDYSDMALNLVDLVQGESTACLLRSQQHGWCSFDGFIRPDAGTTIKAVMASDFGNKK
ncbi:MAG: hypothetical protein GY792_19610 [Gammaproteobacteria bacterium]|nr:hypothetical protein [Gammaproteobacteria bacterium]